MTRNGKIARLPFALREELNKRILDGEPGQSLLDWLHERDDVWDVLEEYFGCAEISDQNLSEWKAGGYQSWLENKEARETVMALARQSQDLGEASEEENMGRCLGNLLMVEFIKLARVLVQKEEDPQKRWKQLKEVNLELCRLRGTNARDIRTSIRQKRSDWEEEDRTEAQAEKHAAQVKKRRLAQYKLIPVVAMMAHGSKDTEAAWDAAAHEVAIEHDLPFSLLEKNPEGGKWVWGHEEEEWVWVERKEEGRGQKEEGGKSTRKQKRTKKKQTKSKGKEAEPEDPDSMESGSIENGPNPTDSN